MKNLITIEDILELAAGLTDGPEIAIDNSDKTIVYSIAKQVFKEVPLTDKQFDLMKVKLSQYKDQFTNLDQDFDFAINNLRYPLREIDRSKYIKIVDGEIKIRFPFRKTEIIEINSISAKTDDYRHSKGTHEHWFGFTETNVLNIMDIFKDKNFEIDKEIKDIYEEENKIRKNPENYLSGVYNSKLKNIHKNLKNYIKETNTLQLIDRKFKYGFNYVDEITPSTLEEKIAVRKSTSYQSKPTLESTTQLLTALWNLDRFPMLVLLEKDSCENQLYELFSYYRDILEPGQQSVLFREDGPNSSFNQLVHDKKLNNWVDKDTKIVYINTNKLPKLLLRGDWEPSTVLSFSSTLDRNINHYINFRCDLIIYREEHTSPFRRYSSYYG